jgi:hypothetical protein
MTATEDFPPWESADRVEFPRDLRELSRHDQDRLFFPIRAGEYVLSVQASGAHASIPAAAVHPDDVSAWEVAVFDRHGRRLDEADPALLSLPREWARYWSGNVGRFVPTPVVRVILQRFELGPDAFDRFVLRSTDPE